MIDENTVWDKIWPVVEQLITATLAEDPQTMQRYLLPGGQAADALDLFGFPVFDILLKIVLGRERLGLTRAIEADDNRVYIEYAWPDPAEAGRRYSAVDVVSVRLAGQEDGAWLIEEINPAAADLPLNAPRAATILAGSSDLLKEDQIPNEPWVLPLTLYAGVLQLPMRTDAMADAVEEALMPGLQARQFGLLSQINGRRLWRDYLAVSRRDYRAVSGGDDRAAAAPALDQPAAWAAGVEFILGELTKKEQTQASVGRPYHVSLGAVSSRAKAIKAALAIADVDDRYSELQTTQIVYKE